MSDELKSAIEAHNESMKKLQAAWARFIEICDAFDSPRPNAPEPEPEVPVDLEAKEARYAEIRKIGAWHRTDKPKARES